MDVYIEVVLADNFGMDLLLLWLTSKLNRTEVPAWRLVAGSLLGSVFALCLPQVHWEGLLLFLLKTLCGVLIYWAGAGEKHFFRGLGLFFALTFLLGGACTALYQMSADFLAGFGYQGFPVGLLALGALGGGVGGVRLVRWLERRKKLGGLLKELVITCGKHTLKTSALLDTGNLVVKDGKGVCIITCDAAARLFGEDFLGLCLKAGEEDYIELVQAHDKKRRILSFMADRVDILDCGQTFSRRQVCFGVTPQRFRDAERYEVLLPASVMEG